MDWTLVVYLIGAPFAFVALFCLAPDDMIEEAQDEPFLGILMGVMGLTITAMWPIVLGLAIAGFVFWGIFKGLMGVRENLRAGFKKRFVK